MRTPIRTIRTLCLLIVAMAVACGIGVLLQHASPAYLQNALVNAAGRGDVAAVQALLARGAKPSMPDRFGITPLVAAADLSPIGRSADLRSAAVVKLLIVHGAPSNARVPNSGEPVINSSAMMGRTAVVQALLDGGADPNVRDYTLGMTPLHWAARGRHPAMVRSLIAYGADVNAKNKGGGTVLMDAAVGGNTAVVKLLLANGANVRARESEKGYTALDMARINDHPNLVPLLERAGTRP